MEAGKPKGELTLADVLRVRDSIEAMIRNQAEVLDTLEELFDVRPESLVDALSFVNALRVVLKDNIQ